MKKLYILILAVLTTACIYEFKERELSDAGYAKWRDNFFDYALKEGISEETLNQTLLQTNFDKSYSDSDRKQLNSKQTLSEYYHNHFNQKLLDQARKLKEQNRDLFALVAMEFKVPAQYILALWAIETKYGTYMGEKDVIEALANLTYDGRREKLFKSELIYALKMLDNAEVFPEDFVGSWAGASGQIQFLPSSFYKYGYDFSNDGIIDIWHDRSDIVASAANYLASLGWDEKLPPLYEVKIDNEEVIKYLNKKRKLAKLLNKFNIEKLDASAFNNYELEQKVQLIQVDSRYFVLFSNYEIINHWNRSQLFAINVSLFAEKI